MIINLWNFIYMAMARVGFNNVHDASAAVIEILQKGIFKKKDNFYFWMVLKGKKKMLEEIKLCFIWYHLFYFIQFYSILFNFMFFYVLGVQLGAVELFDEKMVVAVNKYRGLDLPEMPCVSFF